MFRCSSDPSVEAVEGLWGREVGALLFQPLTHCLWGGNGAANSVLLCCTGCRAEGEPITETQRLPLSLTYLQQEQIVPTINIPICCAHQGLERRGSSLCRPALRETIALDCTATRRKKLLLTPQTPSATLDIEVCG